jgi:hypothetical protein
VAANGAYYDLHAALKKLRASSDRGAAVLISLLKDADSGVVCWAATHLLPLDEVKAKAALSVLSQQGPGLVRLSAELVLIEWNAGRLSVE